MPDTPTQRPLSITITAWLFIAVGVFSLAGGWWREVTHQGAWRADEIGIASMVRLLAIVGGRGLLDGRTWARWLLGGWMAFHIVISARQPAALVTHVVLFGVIGFVLFRPSDSAHLRG